MQQKLKPLLAALLAVYCSATLANAMEADAGTGSDGRTDVRIERIEGPANKNVVIKTNVVTAGQPMAGDGAWFNFGPAFGMHHSQAVKNAPYSAEVINESIQSMADGNQITRKSTTMSYRDSSGRTRQESVDQKGEVKSVNIFDPADGSRLVLSTSSKIATRIGVDKDFAARMEKIRERAMSQASKAAEKQRAAMEKHEAQMAKHGADMEKRAAEMAKRSAAMEKSSSGEEVIFRGNAKTGQDEIIVRRSEHTGPDGKPGVVEERSVRVVHMNGNPAENIRTEVLNSLMREAPIANAFQDHEWQRKASTTVLEERQIEGVRATGKRVSYTIPAGEMGNKNPITVSTETWYSPDLKLTVYSKHSDPRSGDKIFRLANLKRSEPAAALFAVPEGYTVREARTLMPPMPPVPPVPPAPPAAPAAPAK